MKIIICTDAWYPQVSGVVRTLNTTIDILERWGNKVEIINPYEFPGFACPFYKEVRLAYNINLRRLRDAVEQDGNTAIHIATEGPLGIAARRLCLRKKYRFTTAYHTNFPMHLKMMIGFPTSLTYRFLRWFHRPSSCCMVAVDSIADDLRNHKFTNRMGRWSRGVDLQLFTPQKKTKRDRPVAIYVGRVSAEKDIQEFLDCKGNYDKVVVGDGPDRKKLEKKYPDAKFLGYLHGEDLAAAYANADVFVFPSKSDTFGLVLIEALACGVPVAAYPITSPIDIIKGEGVGCLSDNLGEAIEKAITEGVPEKCRQLAQQYSWENCTHQFLKNLVPAKQKQEQST